MFIDKASFSSDEWLLFDQSYESFIFDESLLTSEHRLLMILVTINYKWLINNQSSNIINLIDKLSSIVDDGSLIDNSANSHQSMMNHQTFWINYLMIDNASNKHQCWSITINEASNICDDSWWLNHQSSNILNYCFSRN